MPRFYLEAKRAESALRLGVQCSPLDVRMDSSGIAVLQREADTPFLVDESDSSRHRERETGMDHTCRAMTKAIKRKRRKPRMNKGLPQFPVEQRRIWPNSRNQEQEMVCGCLSPHPQPPHCLIIHSVLPSWGEMIASFLKNKEQEGEGKPSLCSLPLSQHLLPPHLPPALALRC